MQDAKKIRKDEKLWIATDQTTNFYHVEPDSYDNLTEKSITKSYKKAPAGTISNITSKEKEIAESLDLDD